MIYLHGSAMVRVDRPFYPLFGVARMGKYGELPVDEPLTIYIKEGRSAALDSVGVAKMVNFTIVMVTTEGKRYSTVKFQGHIWNTHKGVHKVVPVGPVNIEMVGP